MCTSSGDFGNLRDDKEAEADVGHIDPVHHVAVEHIRTRFFRTSDFVFQMEKIRRKKGR